MKVECKSIKRNPSPVHADKVMELKNGKLVEKDMTKKRNSSKSLAPRVKRPPNKQYKELKKQGKKLFDISEASAVKKGISFEGTWESYKAQRTKEIVLSMLQLCGSLEEWLNPESQMQCKHKALLESQLGQMTRKVTVTAEDIHAENQKKGKK